MALEIDANPQRGPSFLPGESGPLFRFVIDRANIVGPRAATEADKAAYPGEWSLYLAEHPEPAEEPLKSDHNGDGKPGNGPKIARPKKPAAKA